MANNDIDNESFSNGKINMTWVTYIIVWLFLGYFGVHRFMAGKYGSGVGMLLLAVFGYILTMIIIGYFFLLAVGIWWVYDGIQLMLSKFEDYRGFPIKMKKTIS